VPDAVELLGRVDYPFPSLLLTRTAIQFALLSGAQRLEALERLPLDEEDQREAETDRSQLPVLDRRMAEAIWKLLDRFDDLTPDRRLLAALEETKSASEEGRPLVIVTGLAQEVDFIVAAIR
jgi:hypothetical protein